MVLNYLFLRDEAINLSRVALRSDSQQSATVVVVFVDVFICVCVAVAVVIVGVIAVAIVDDLQLIINPIHDPCLSLISDISHRIVFMLWW